MPQKDKLAFGLVGCGHIGLLHARIIRSLGELVAICDPDTAKTKHFPGADEVHIYVGIEDMLTEEKGLDVVVVCSPNGLHATHSIMALERGIHVLCEKPMAIKVDDAEAMRFAAAKYRKHLVIVKQNRYNFPVALLKKFIEEGKFGRLFSVQVNCFWNRNNAYYENAWRGSRELDGGTLFTQYSHFVDLLYWLFGDVAQMYAIMDNFNHRQQVDFEDTGVVCMRFSNGMLGAIHFTINAYNSNMEGSLTLFGEKGTMKVGGAYLNKIEYCTIEGVFDNEKINWEAASAADAAAEKYQSHEEVYRHFIYAIKNNEPTDANLNEALKTVDIIERMYRCSGMGTENKS